jgi:hypothetical protein
MRWKNTSTPTFAGSAGSAGKPSVVETMQLLDDAGNEVAVFTKAVDGGKTASLGGTPLVRITTTRVQTNVGTKQALLAAVPTGKVRIVTRVVWRNASINLSGWVGDIGLGFSGGAEDWWLSSDGAIIVGLTSSAKASSHSPEVSPFSVGLATEVFGMIFNQPDPEIAATLDIDVHYYDVDA